MPLNRTQHIPRVCMTATFQHERFVGQVIESVKVVSIGCYKRGLIGFARRTVCVRRWPQNFLAFMFFTCAEINEPRASCRAKKAARFLAGGSCPIAISLLVKEPLKLANTARYVQICRRLSDPRRKAGEEDRGRLLVLMASLKRKSGKLWCLIPMATG